MTQTNEPPGKPGRFISFTEHVLREQKRLQELLLPLIESARNEIGMPIDIAKYRDAVDPSIAYTSEQLNRLFHAGDRQ